jgi:hypothetical protein
VGSSAAKCMIRNVGLFTKAVIWCGRVHYRIVRKIIIIIKKSCVAEYRVNR